MALAMTRSKFSAQPNSVQLSPAIFVNFDRKPFCNVAQNPLLTERSEGETSSDSFGFDGPNPLAALTYAGDSGLTPEISYPREQSMQTIFWPTPALSNGWHGTSIQELF